MRRRRAIARPVGKPTRDRAIQAHLHLFFHRERLLPFQGIEERAGTPISMLDVLIERLSYDPMAIFIAVAIVLLIMLGRTL